MNIVMTQSIKRAVIVLSMVVLGISALLPQTLWAASAYLAADNAVIAVGDTAIVSVIVNTEGRKPNTIEGDIEFSGGAKNITISEFSLAGSALRFWPKTPSLDSPAKISFIGGTPGGFKSNAGLLFKIIFTADAAGQVVFSPKNFKLYDNDGKATLLDTSSQPLSVTIDPKTTEPKNHWLDIITGDTEAPHDITVTFGQNSEVYNGQKFMTISAIDDQSGIDHYEVSEGDRPAVRSGSAYVLMDQREKSVLTVSAYDKAGNVSKILVTPTDSKPSANVWVSVGIVLVILAIGYILLWVLKKRKSSKKIGF
jgi:hypothetical protein